MAQIKEPLEALKLKYKDKPEKLQAETMALWKKHKINPAAGCVPLLIQFPLFIAFNGMLRTASELRFASFLWIQNLSAPDTIARIHIPNLPIIGNVIPINVLPIIYSSCSFLQMRMMPAPTTDSSQRMMMQLMPLMMFFFFYTMPAGMVLYFTCQVILTVFQQWLMRRSVDNNPAPPLAAAPVGPSVRRK
jgi:YidC/Oxa1 family membrane protein insertase